MPGLLSQLPPQTMSGLLKQAPNQAAGLTRGLLYGGLGAPVDLANMMLLGAGGQRPVGGSAWLEGKLDPYLSRMIGQPNAGQNAARLVGDVVAPGPGEFAGASKALQGLLADPATATKLQQMVGGLLGMTAYHGSPHKFDKFRLADDTIGTGEGAQAYGHGLYFAENPGVARSYIKTPENWADQANVKSSAYREAQAEILKIERELRQKHGSNIPKDEISAFMYAEQNADKFDAKLMERIKAARQAEEKAYKDFSAGSLYTVDIPDDQIAKMLDWDRPLSEQPEAVRKALGRVSTEFQDQPLGALLEKAFRNEMYAGDILGVDRATKSDISRYFKENGIPGIRYLDGQSRKAGEGTRNFVVFDDSILKILNRE